MRARAAAALLCASFALGGCGGGEGGAREEACGPGPRVEAVAGDLPSGLQSGGVPPDLLEDFEKRMDSEHVRRLTGRSVLRNGEPVAYVLVAEADAPLPEDRFYEGVERAVGDLGIQVQVGRRLGRMFELEQGASAIIGSAGRCSAVIVLAESPGQARNVAASLRV